MADTIAVTLSHGKDFSGEVARKMHLCIFLKKQLTEKSKLCSKRTSRKIQYNDIILENKYITNLFELFGKVNDEEMRSEMKKFHKSEEDSKRDWTKAALIEYLDVLLEMFLYDYGHVSRHQKNYNKSNQNNNFHREEMKAREIEITNILLMIEDNREALSKSNDFTIELFVTVQLWKRLKFPFYVGNIK